MHNSQLMLNLAAHVESEDARAAVLGEVFTRRWVVELILDLVGYTAERELAGQAIVEPACGEGAFLAPIIDRLLASRKAHDDHADLRDAVRAFDLSDLNVERARKLVVTTLVDAGLPLAEAQSLAATWVRRADFLLDNGVAEADFVVGNPPYIRLEDVSPHRTAAYRSACPTMRGRSDVYVGFIERGLRLLRPEGALGFIVADRWMHNQYGADLRRLVGTGYSVDAVIEMHDVDAFENEVSAYPAVTVIRRRPQGAAVLASTTKEFGAHSAHALGSWVSSGRRSVTSGRGFAATRMPTWFPGDELWPSGDPARLAIVSSLERRFAPLEDPSTGTRVGIGVATGADEIYITEDDRLVEQDRLLPLVLSTDVTSGRLEWSGSMLVNPWESDGRLVDLNRYPKLHAYLREYESRLRNRHVAMRRPESWYRTIDRVTPGLLKEPKLLLPDIKASSHPVLDEGHYYPHHNLYFVTSTSWDLRVLGGLLLSKVANLFVGAYCVKMRGGFYRFQAQYIRKIRVPSPDAIGRRDKQALARAFVERDVDAATIVAQRVYDIEELPTS